MKTQHILIIAGLLIAVFFLGKCSSDKTDTIQPVLENNVQVAKSNVDIANLKDSFIQKFSNDSIKIFRAGEKSAQERQNASKTQRNVNYLNIVALTNEIRNKIIDSIQGIDNIKVLEYVTNYPILVNELQDCQKENGLRKQETKQWEIKYNSTVEKSKADSTLISAQDKLNTHLEGIVKPKFFKRVAIFIKQKTAPFLAGVATGITGVIIYTNSR